MQWSSGAAASQTAGRGIRSLECKTLLDPGATFEAKSLAHICPSWVMIQLVAPFRMLTSHASHHSVCLKHLYLLTVGPKLACLDNNWRILVVEQFLRA